MKQKHIKYVLPIISVILLGACRKQDPVEEMEKAAAAMSKMETPPASSEASGNPEAAAPPPGTQLQQAISDYKSGKMEDAVTRLQLLRAQPILSPQQRMALQDSIAAVMTEIYTLAEKGDARAIAAVAQYEKLQTSRR